MSLTLLKEHMADPKFKEIVEECCVLDLETGVGMVAHHGKWYVMGITVDGVPYPTSKEVVDTDIPSPPKRVTPFWILDYEKRPLSYSLMRAMFYNHGPKLGVDDKDWVRVKMDGSVNFPIRIEKDVAYKMLERINGYLYGDKPSEPGLRICDVMGFGCKCEFELGLHNIEGSKCPFSTYHHVLSRTTSSCATIDVEGITLDSVEEDIGKYWGGELDSLSNEAKMWLVGMQALYESF